MSAYYVTDKKEGTSSPHMGLSTEESITPGTQWISVAQAL